GEGAQGIGEDAEHQGTLASDAVGDETEEHAADAGSEQGQGGEEAGHGLAHAEIANDVGQNQRVEHSVESIEHPAESSSEKSPALSDGGVGESGGRHSGDSQFQMCGWQQKTEKATGAIEAVRTAGEDSMKGVDDRSARSDCTTGRTSGSHA